MALSVIWSAFLAVSIFLTDIASSQRPRIKYENDRCKNDDPRWICRRLADCSTGQMGIREGKVPEICSFEELEPIVCCPPSNREPVNGGGGSLMGTTSTTEFVNWEDNFSEEHIRPSRTPATPTRQPTFRPPLSQTNRPWSQTNQGSSQTNRPSSQTNRPSSQTNRPSKSQQMCEKYAEYVFRLEESPVLIGGGSDELEKVDECGRVEQPLILGGEDAREKEFPHMAQIGYGEKANYWLCGGSLISDRFVLSAAHCTEPENRGPALWVRLGEYDTSRDDDGPRPQVIRISQRINHPQYDSNKLYNDISLYRLSSPAKLGPYVRPICLHTSNQIDGNQAIATGWGHTTYGGRGSNILQKVKLNIISTEVCNVTYKENIGVQLPRGILASSQVCAGDERGKDACQGDSGGPLQIPLRKPYCMYAVVGVTSVGRGCGQVAGIYTRVSNFVPWIEKTVWS